MFRTRAACPRRTAFGRPVEPEVMTKMASSLPAIRAGHSTAPACRALRLRTRHQRSLESRRWTTMPSREDIVGSDPAHEGLVGARGPWAERGAPRAGAPGPGSRRRWGRRSLPCPTIANSATTASGEVLQEHGDPIAPRHASRAQLGGKSLRQIPEVRVAQHLGPLGERDGDLRRAGPSLEDRRDEVHSPAALSIVRTTLPN